ncbi:hypothetical protein EJ06DRAFT_529593 [Trichodelitschia bisporula]|uniref:Uncharacterized protein n=1 Tax=Trichodelitschia bisporula TaxID=703511 RepID=A0A6G1HZY2_9PEZI|nr:hypothetical protein EJ06DRAFT_529593 [Trichodelitschia bisporula]
MLSSTQSSVARAAARVAVGKAPFVGGVRGFAGSAVRMVGKEDALHTDGRAEDVDFHKKDQLDKSKRGEQHWKDELASNSESIVKAERGDIKASKDTIEQLQRETENLMKKKDH